MTVVEAAGLRRGAGSSDVEEVEGMSDDARRMQECDDEKGGRGIEREIARRLYESRIITYANEVSRKTAHDLIVKLLALNEEDPARPIRLFLNSPGGDVDAGFAIFDVIRFIGAPVDIVCTGLAASAGVVILLASPKERRVTLPHARFLIHQPSSGAHGDASDIEIEAGEILKCRQAINEIIARETGQPVDKVEKDTRRNFWMSAKEALDYGLVSRIIERRSELGD
jgi:ATP-dependent Clp protease protease subunit